MKFPNPNEFKAKNKQMYATILTLGEGKISQVIYRGTLSVNERETFIFSIRINAPRDI